MSYNFYNLDGIKTELRKDIARSSAYLEAWKKVSFPTKKDGTPFKIMSKNIAGATYQTESYAMQPLYEHELTVYTYAEGLGYIHDTVKLYELVRYLKNDTMLAKKQNYAPKETLLEQVYCYDLEDIKNAVNARIAKLEKEVEQLEYALSVSDKVYTDYREAYKKAMDLLAEESKKIDNCNLYLYVRDTVLGRYPYC